MKLVFASNNAHKLAEIKQVFGNRFNILSLNDIGCTTDIAETGATLEENASIKSRFVFDNYGLNCFSDDSGLEIDSLNGQPGVRSARFAGNQCSAEDNMAKVIFLLKEKENRDARFRTVISLFIDGKELFFEGRIEGVILLEKKGNGGFGYDPLFMPAGYSKSFAEFLPSEKNQISHRGTAIQRMTKSL